jgi:hypothetical protein
VWIYIRSLPHPLEIDDHKKLRNWKRIRRELQTGSAGLRALAEKISLESEAGQPEFPVAVPAARLVLPSVFPLPGETGEIRMPFLTGEQPGTLPFPVGPTMPFPSLPPLQRFVDHQHEPDSPQAPQWGSECRT